MIVDASTWILLGGAAAAVATIVTLAIALVRAHAKIGDLRGELATALIQERKADEERIDAARARVRAELELDERDRRILELETAAGVVQTRLKEIYDVLRKNGLPGAAVRIDDLFNRMQSELAPRAAEAAVAARGADPKLPDQGS